MQKFILASNETFLMFPWQIVVKFSILSPALPKCGNNVNERHVKVTSRLLFSVHPGLMYGVPKKMTELSYFGTINSENLFYIDIF